MLRAGYAAVKAVRPQEGQGADRQHVEHAAARAAPGAVAPLEFLRELACVDAELKPRTTPDCANFTTLPGDGWAHHPYSQNERPSRVSKPTARARRPAHGRPAAARDDARPARQDGPHRARQPQHLPDGVRLRDPAASWAARRSTSCTQARWLTWAEYLADKVPTVRSFAQFLLRDQPPRRSASRRARRGPSASTRPGCCVADGKDKIAAKTFVAGLFAQKRSKGRVLLYGRLRLGAGHADGHRPAPPPGRALGEHRHAEDRRPLVVHAHDRRTSPGSLYRLGYPRPDGQRKTSIAIKPVPAGR